MQYSNDEIIKQLDDTITELVSLAVMLHETKKEKAAANFVEAIIDKLIDWRFTLDAM